MKSFKNFLAEYTNNTTGHKLVPYLPKGAVSGLEYKTAPDDEFDAVVSKSGQEIRISQKDKGYYIMADGSYFVKDYKDKDAEPKAEYSHFFGYPNSDDSRISLDKFRLYLPDLQELFGEELKNTLVYSRDMRFKVVDRKGNIIEEFKV